MIIKLRKKFSEFAHIQNISRVCEKGHRFLIMMFEIPEVFLIILIVNSSAGR